jgi:hypothetical protein
MRQRTVYTAGWSNFRVSDETAEKLKKISPASIDRYLKKDKEAFRLKGKSLAKPPVFPEKPYPDTCFLLWGGTENTRFPAN